MHLGKTLLLLAFSIIISVSTATFAADRGIFSTEPTKHNGQKWRIGYYEGGPFSHYQGEFQATIRGLMALGWIEQQTIPKQQGEQTKALWNWLSKDVHSDYIEFVQDAHYSAEWNDNTRKAMAERLVQRLNQQQDIDLLIAMGTWAGKDFANNRHHVPTIVMSTSDPLAAGIIKSVEDSGFDHIHAQVDPSHYSRQVEIFHELIGFEKLGIAYENTVNGRSYAGLSMLEKLSKERDFTLVSCFTQSDISDTATAEKSVTDCFENLVNRVDAIYVTNQGGVTEKSLPLLVKIANDNHIPTFSQSGSEQVEKGFLASMSRAGFKYIGEFYAMTLAKVFNGAKPNQLNQLFQEPPRMAVNLETAEAIGFNPPLLLLGAADEIYTATK